MLSDMKSQWLANECPTYAVKLVLHVCTEKCREALEQRDFSSQHTVTNPLTDAEPLIKIQSSTFHLEDVFIIKMEHFTVIQREWQWRQNLVMISSHIFIWKSQSLGNSPEPFSQKLFVNKCIKTCSLRKSLITKGTPQVTLIFFQSSQKYSTRQSYGKCAQI